jgi:hypothetical protein
MQATLLSFAVLLSHFRIQHENPSQRLQLVAADRATTTTIHGL